MYHSAACVAFASNIVGFSPQTSSFLPTIHFPPSHPILSHFRISSERSGPIMEHLLIRFLIIAALAATVAAARPTLFRNASAYPPDRSTHTSTTAQGNGYTIDWPVCNSPRDHFAARDTATTTSCHACVLRDDGFAPQDADSILRDNHFAVRDAVTTISYLAPVQQDTAQVSASSYDFAPQDTAFSFSSCRPVHPPLTRMDHEKPGIVSVRLSNLIPVFLSDNKGSNLANGTSSKLFVNLCVRLRPILIL